MPHTNSRLKSSLHAKFLQTSTVCYPTVFSIYHLLSKSIAFINGKLIAVHCYISRWMGYKLHSRWKSILYVFSKYLESMMRTTGTSRRYPDDGCVRERVRVCGRTLLGDAGESTQQHTLTVGTHMVTVPSAEPNQSRCTMIDLNGGPGVTLNYWNENNSGILGRSCMNINLIKWGTISFCPKIL